MHMGILFGTVVRHAPVTAAAGHGLTREQAAAEVRRRNAEAVAQRQQQDAAHDERMAQINQATERAKRGAKAGALDSEAIYRARREQSRGVR
jgi:hypothetical protein